MTGPTERPPESPPASFAELAGRSLQPAAELLPLVRDAFRRADFRTAWLLADRLTRATGGEDPLAHVLRASALARLGRPEAMRAALERAAFLDPYDRLANEAIIASGEPAKQIKALCRLIDSMAEPLPAAVATGLRRFGRSILIRGTADESGFSVEAFAPQSTTVTLTWRDEGAASEIVLKIDQPAEGALFTGRQHVAWPDDRAAVALSSADDRAFIHPATLHRPGAAPIPPAAPDPAAEGGETGLLVVVPVYDDLEATRACFASLLAHLPDGAVRIVAVDDVTPELGIAGLLDELAGSGRVELVRNVVNLGFAASVNRALRGRRAGEDVLLLNADTIVPPGAIARLQDIARADPRIGTVTPLSNNGEDTSVPRRFRSSPLGSAAEVASLNDLAWQANGSAAIAMPNGVGFCMLISAGLLAVQPELPMDYGRGYFEDVAYCLAARRHGFENVCAVGVYVGHSGSRSFLDDKRSLVRRNLERLKQRFPDYDADADIFFRADPIAGFAARLERDWLADRSGLTLVLLAAEPDREIGLLVAAALRVEAADLVFAHIVRPAEAPILAVRGADQKMPQNLSLSLATRSDGNWSDPLVPLLVAEAASVVVIDPHRLPPIGLSLVRARTAGWAALFLSHAEDAPPPAIWADGLGEGHGATSRTTVHFRRIGLGVSLVDGGPDAPHKGGNPPDLARWDVLYCLPEPAGEPLGDLARKIGGAAAETGASPFTVAVLAEPDGSRAAERVAWVGTVERGELADWLALAGPGPCFFASRRYGLSDERIDEWAQAGLPVAYFDPDSQAIREEGGRLVLPVGLGDAEAAAAVAGWMSRLGRT
jgi:O-antigen biosynthesis protein